MFHDAFLRQPFMSSTGLQACSARSWIQAMCDFELALIQAHEQNDRVPAGTHQQMRSCLRAEAFDAQALQEQTPEGGNVAIPFVKQAKALLPAALRADFHKGATSQDVIDTAMMCLLKPRLARCLKLGEQALSQGAELMQQHRDTPMIGRTLTQQALPITFGAKMAQWLNGLWAAIQRLQSVHDHDMLVQFGGPVAAHHGLTDGLAMMDQLASLLDLQAPSLPWHTNRQPILAIIDSVGSVAVAGEKIATDIAAMAQTEVAEVQEPAATGAGGSSSMPHKSNPVGSTRIRMAARQIHASLTNLHYAGAQLHERAFGAWHSEWAPLMDAVLLLEGLLETLVPLIGQLQVHTRNMRANIELAHGANLREPAVALLSRVMTAEQAQTLARQASDQARQEGLDYARALYQQPGVARHFTRQQVLAGVDPLAWCGTSGQQVDRLAALLSSRNTG